MNTKIFTALLVFTATFNAWAQDVAKLPAVNAPTTQTRPFSLERFNLPGPVTGVAVKVDLDDPRVHVQVALADNRDPDGAGPCVGLLDTPSNVARKQDFQITLNASYFAAPVAREFAGQKIRYFVGNGAYPVGWHFSDGKLISSPAKDGMRATIIVHTNGKVTINDHVKNLPADTQFAVSGNAMILSNGMATPPSNDSVRHPRSAVGISKNGKTLIMIAVDGRQERSRGVTLGELAAIFQRYEAENAINLDGGGSTSLVLKDPGTGVFSVINQPSDLSSLKLTTGTGIGIAIERPVVDVIGIKIDSVTNENTAVFPVPQTAPKTAPKTAHDQPSH